MREFENRLAKIRARFVTTLESKIKDNFAVMPQLAGDQPQALTTIGDMYRRFHELCAIAPTVGFEQTGKAARAAEVVLFQARFAKRGLTATELTSLKKVLNELWSAAQAELQSMYHRGV